MATVEVSFVQFEAKTSQVVGANTAGKTGLVPVETTTGDVLDNTFRRSSSVHTISGSIDKVGPTYPHNPKMIPLSYEYVSMLLTIWT